jgi:hypothetical protein
MALGRGGTATRSRPSARAQWTPTSEGARVLPGLAGLMGDSPHVVALALELFRGVPVPVYGLRR